MTMTEDIGIPSARADGEFGESDKDYRFETLYPGTPEQQEAASKKPGFLRIEFQHPSGRWRDYVPLRQEAAPAQRAVYADNAL